MDRNPESRDLWLATRNSKKAAELQRILSSHRVRILSELPNAEDFEVEEDQPDFCGNARKKAVETAAWLREVHDVTKDGDLVVADDSGLVVPALHGAPGVHSARYAGPGATDRDRNDKLLRELHGKDRAAHFVCCVALVDHLGNERFVHEGICEGRIADAARGDAGFGYDPVFLPAAHDFERTFAELSGPEKDAISHRGRALGALRDHLDQAETSESQR